MTKKNYMRAWRKKHRKRYDKYMKRWRKKHRKQLAVHQRVWYWANHERALFLAKRYARRNKHAVVARGLVYRKRNRKKIARRMRRYQQVKGPLLKLEVFGHYCRGKIRCQCKNCPTRHIDLLTLDHVKGDGKSHRTPGGTRLTSLNLCAWLKRRKFPRGFQILCGTCNLAKGAKFRCPRYGKKH